MINALLILAIVVLAIQVALFFVIRAKKRKLKRESVVDKYHIRSRADAWKLLNKQDLDDEDRQKISELYKNLE